MLPNLAVSKPAPIPPRLPYMRLLILLLSALSACGQSPAPATPAPETPTAVSSPWFLCDGVDAPALFVFERDGSGVRVTEYDKPNGAIVERSAYELGAEEGAMGSVYTALLRNGVEAGAIRQTNPAMLESPGSAYTLRISEVRLGERRISCRWLPRTRLISFTGRRSVVVHEDADGDLIYSSFNFTDAAGAGPIELSENGLSTTFSAEARGGEEALGRESAEFRFAAEGYTYVVTAGRDGTGSLDVLRDGEQVQSEPLVAFLLGDAQE